ncbi:MAG TPA: STY0301 family protein [Ignavibacteriaceae bacterium]|nr:STY0301 family protein [Ignavibacteriaceae bacterium]
MGKVLISLTIIIFGWILIGINQSNGFPDQLVYPDKIIVKQALVNIEPGWESFEDDVRLQLTSIGIFEGHPKEKTSLVPDKEDKFNGYPRSIWYLAENGKRNYWIACYYDRTSIVLTRKIDFNISYCEVIYNSDISIAGHPVVLDVNFK